MLCRKLFRGRLSVAGGLSKCIRRKYEDRADGELWHRNGCLHAGKVYFAKDIDGFNELVRRYIK